MGKVCSFEVFSVQERERPRSLRGDPGSGWVRREYGQSVQLCHDFGPPLAARCQAVGWDISRGTFTRIESGLRRVNDAELVNLAKVLRCGVADLLEEATVRKAVAIARHVDTES
ncbi:MAG: helix-turn-helix transcriptional regulator [Verrucomicrobiota bacterium]